MMKKYLFFIFMGISLFMIFGASPEARAGGTIKIDDEKWISVGAGLRTDFSMVQNGAPNGTDQSKDITLDNVRLFTDGQILPHIKFIFNTEYNGSYSVVSPNTIQVLDAIARLEFSDYFNIWMGRLLPPSDRSNLDGPFYLATFKFPGLAQHYPALYVGRDNGLSLWGQVNGGQFKYQVGAFQGRIAGPNQSGNKLYAGRLTLNLLDPEPGYFNASSYYGTKDVLAFGLVAMTQQSGVGTPANPGNFKGWSLDGLFDRKLGEMGVLTVEGAYYSYDLGGIPDPAFVQGKSYMALVGYLIPQKVGTGNFQPHIRYQSLSPDSGYGNDQKLTELGVNYIMDGHNANLALIYGRMDPGGGASTTNNVTLGIQLQI